MEEESKVSRGDKRYTIVALVASDQFTLDKMI